MSHLAPSYHVLWLSKDKSFGKVAFFGTILSRQKQILMTYHTQIMQPIQVKTFSVGRISY